MLAGTVLPHRGDLLSFQAAVASRAATTGLVGEAILALQVTVAQADRATDAWSDARTRAVTIAKLEERHDAAVQAEELRLEQLVLDESATRRHLSGQDDLPAGPTARAPAVDASAPLPSAPTEEDR